MNKSKLSLVTFQIVEKIQLMGGIFILFIFGICTIMAIADPSYREDGFLIVCIVFDAIGVLLIYFARKRRKLVKSFKIYVAKLSTDYTGSIVNLASELNTSQDVVKANLKKMLEKKFFVNAYLDENNNRIIFPGNSSAMMPTTSSVGDVSQPNIPYAAVKCVNCGGITKVAIGRTCECDFCGTPITGR